MNRREFLKAASVGSIGLAVAPLVPSLDSYVASAEMRWAPFVGAVDISDFIKDVPICSLHAFEQMGLKSKGSFTLSGYWDPA